MGARPAAGCLAVAGLGCFVLAGYLAFLPVTPGYVVEQPDRRLEGLVPGRDHEVEFRVCNLTARDLRALGAAWS